MCSRFPDRPAALLAITLYSTLLATGCEREERRFDPPAPGSRVQAEERASMIAHYERNAYALSTGKRLWTWYNCNGCHANGGGASGPALLDDKWIYGGDALSIYRTIAEGRPNGMPGYAGRVPEDELWQLTAYVRSMAGLAPQDAAPNRDDAFLTRPPESLTDARKPASARPAAAARQP
jgi:cytochrome c oxidase cbb3-type subunit 3